MVVLTSLWPSSSCTVRMPIDCIRGKSWPSTCLYKNSKALSACRCVAGDTCRSLANMVKKASTSDCPMSRRRRMTPLRPCQRMKKRAQYTYAFSVCKLKCKQRIRYRTWFSKRVARKTGEATLRVSLYLFIYTVYGFNLMNISSFLTLPEPGYFADRHTIRQFHRMHQS